MWHVHEFQLTSFARGQQGRDVLREENSTPDALQLEKQGGSVSQGWGHSGGPAGLANSPLLKRHEQCSYTIVYSAGNDTEK